MDNGDPMIIAFEKQYNNIFYKVAAGWNNKIIKNKFNP